MSSKYDTSKKIADRLVLLQSNVEAQASDTDEQAAPRAKLATFVSAHHQEIVNALRFHHNETLP